MAKNVPALAQFREIALGAHVFPDSSLQGSGQPFRRALIGNLPSVQHRQLGATRRNIFDDVR